MRTRRSPARGTVASRVVALPAAAQPDVAAMPFRDVDRDPAAAIRHVMPHQVARLRHVDRLDQEERRDVLDLAARISWRELDVCDDAVVRRSVGSSSPNARPAIVSYWPAAPNAAPSNAGDTTESMTMRVT